MAYIGKEPVRGQNRELDDISGSFNGGNTAFTMQVGGINTSAGSANQCFISVGGVLQNPGTDFTVASSTITFTTPPASGLDFWGIIQGDAVDINTPADASVTNAKIVDDTIKEVKLDIDNAPTNDHVLTADSTTGGGMKWAAASGTTSAGLAFGGQSSTAVVGVTESWDGTSWTETADMSTARETLAGSKSASNPATLAFGGGDGPPFSDATEEFNISTSATTAGAWANSNNLNTARRGTNNGGCGIQTAALLAGGNSSQPGTTIIDNSEEYDGSSWTEGNNLNTARYNASGAGTQTAGLAVGGFKTDFPEAGETEEYNGTSWTAGNDNSTVRQEGSLAGSQTAALYAGGRAGSPTTYYANVEYYDGTNWTSAPANMPGSRAGGAGAGTQTAYITVGGVIPPGPPFSPTNTSLEWDGSSWTAGGDYLVSVFGAVGAGGIQTSALFAGSDSSPQNTHASFYDGRSFATNPSLATGRHDSGGLHGGTSTSTAGLVYSGPTGSVSAATEEFTGETTALRSAKTIDFD